MIQKNLMRELMIMYVQDFDIVFEEITDPVELFCRQHNARERNQLLIEMKDFYADVLAGKRSARDLIRLGLEYVPHGDWTLRSWFPKLIGYLETQPETS